ncbi:hypothetical protein [Neisseria sp.]|uniref:hypothetical protein n=1 Tax=Neisseria sp. TaxID=192066 RepID=UPI00359FC180
MFKRPEELIMLALAVLWTVCTYFLAGWLGAPVQTSLLIACLTLIWAGACFLIWQRGFSRWLWPLFSGFLVACWWPFLDWYAVSGIVMPQAAGDTLVVNLPWYATWTFKIIIALVPVAVCYALLWRSARKRKQQQPLPSQR